MKVGILVKGAFSQATEEVKREGQQSKTAEAVDRTLQECGYETTLLSLAPPDFALLRDLDHDVIFNLYAATGDEQALVSSVLDLLGVPYTGCSALGHFLALNKQQAKSVWLDKGVRTPPSPDGETPSSTDFPLFVKPARGGSGEGIYPSSIIHDQAELDKHLAWLDKGFSPLLVEQYIPGRELTVGLLGDPVEVLPPLEISFDRLPPGYPPINSFDAKHRYYDLVDVTRAELSPQVEAEVRRVALEAFKALELRDSARADFRLDDEGQPWIVEINSLPGLQPEYSYLPQAAELAGMSYRDLIWEMVQLALDRG